MPAMHEILKMSLLTFFLSLQLYGRVTKNSRAKTERIFDYIHCQCKFKLDQLIPSADLM